MKILVSGGTGFIGSNFINEAITAGVKVVAIKRINSTPKVKLIKEPVWIEGELDLCLYDKIEGCDILVHFAANGVTREGNWAESINVNINKSFTLFENARNSGIKKFILIGSCFEYGRSGDDFNCISKNSCLKPVDSYAASKAAASMLFYGWAVDNNLKLSILRLFQVYGEGESQGRLWPMLVKSALNGEDLKMSKGTQIRDFIHVKVVAKKIIDALQFKKVKSGFPEIVNVGTGAPKTIFEFANYWWDKFNAKGNLKFNEIPMKKNEVMRYVAEI